MSSLNRIIIIGRLVSPADVKVTTNGSTRATFSVAVDRPAAPGAEVQQDRFLAVCWDAVADAVSQTIHEGDLVLIEGQIRERSYDAEDGQRKWVTEIEARAVKAITKGASEASVSASEPEAAFSDLGGSPLQEKPVASAEGSEFNFSETAQEEDVPF